jgi:hypothetical protein
MLLGSNLTVTLIDLYILSPIRCSLPTSFTVLEERKRDGKRRERKRRKIGKNTWTSKVLPSLPPWAMAEQDWTPCTIMSGHQQKLIKHGFMAATELEAYRVLEDPVFLAHAKGYVVSFVAFYE